jgi:hypothetical protein
MKQISVLLNNRSQSTISCIWKLDLENCLCFKVDELIHLLHNEFDLLLKCNEINNLNQHLVNLEKLTDYNLTQF